MKQKKEIEREEDGCVPRYHHLCAQENKKKCLLLLQNRAPEGREFQINGNMKRDNEPDANYSPQFLNVKNKKSLYVTYQRAELMNFFFLLQN